MDGVLCDSETLLARAACRLFADRYGVSVEPHEFIPFVGTGEKRYLDGVAVQHGIGQRHADDKDRLYAMYLEMVPGCLQPTPGAVAFVQACRRRGLRTAVATSADRVKLDGALAVVGLPPEEFDVTVTGSDIRHAKPDPEIFLVAAATLGLPPEACLVVEDAEHGIAAARAAGCPCLALTTTFSSERLQKSRPDWIVHTLADAHAISRALRLDCLR